ncbi:MAG TPA: hypothetical protein VGJ94_02645 [Syntrophorhabdaceae bacterium]
MDRNRAEGNCTGRDGSVVPFELWSQATTNYFILAQGPDTFEPARTWTYGLRIAGKEQGPSDEHWKGYLQNPRSLCVKACGGEWREK